MTAQTITLMKIFWHNWRGTNGEVPNCKGCIHNNASLGCDHKENPMTIMEMEVRDDKLRRTPASAS